MVGSAYVFSSVCCCCCGSASPCGPPPGREREPQNNIHEQFHFKVDRNAEVPTVSANVCNFVREISRSQIDLHKETLNSEQSRLKSSPASGANPLLTLFSPLMYGGGPGTAVCCSRASSGIGGRGRLMYRGVVLRDDPGNRSTCPLLFSSFNLHVSVSLCLIQLLPEKNAPNRYLAEVAGSCRPRTTRSRRRMPCSAAAARCARRAAAASCGNRR